MICIYRRRYSSSPFTTLELEAGVLLASRSGPLYCRESSGTHLQEAGWASRKVWTGTSILAPIGNRSQYRPVLVEPLPITVTWPCLVEVPGTVFVYCTGCLEDTDGCFQILYHHSSTLLGIK